MVLHANGGPSLLGSFSDSDVGSSEPANALGPPQREASQALPDGDCWRSRSRFASLRVPADQSRPDFLQSISLPPLQSERVHRKVTEGMGEEAPAGRARNPGVLERAREEMEAIVHTILEQKDGKVDRREQTGGGEGGFWDLLGESLSRFCSPWMTGHREKE